MNRCRETSFQPGLLASRTIVFVVIAFLAPVGASGQCQPVTATSKPVPSTLQGSPPSTAEAGKPEFYDEPKFTVSGVTDTTNLGGHGSDTVVRTKESLARDAAALSRGATHDSTSIPYLEQAVRLNPSDDESAYALAVAYADAGKYQDSRARIKDLLASQDKAEFHHLLGEVAEKLNDPLEAVREFQRAAGLSPTEPHLFDWGAELLAHRAAQPAIEVFAEGNRLFPHSVRMLVGLGVSWYVRGSYDQAALHLCEASDLNPSDPTPYVFLGKMQNAEPVQSGGLVERLERFARLQPENAWANYYYAIALWKRSKGAADSNAGEQVQSLLEKAVHLDPKLSVAHLQLGIVYSGRGDLPKAISAYQWAVAANPGLEEPHYRLADAYRRIGDKAQAQRELELYSQLTKKKKEDTEHERHEIQQFVFSLRDRNPASDQQQKP